MQMRNLKILVVKIPMRLDQALKLLAGKTGRSKSHYVRQALERFLKDGELYFGNQERFKNNGPYNSQ